MELIIAIIIIAIGVAIWYNRKAPAQPVVEAETYSDNGIKFASIEETVVVVTTPAVVEVVSAPVVVETTLAKKTRAPRAPKAEKAPKAATPKAPAKKTTTAKSKKA